MRTAGPDGVLRGLIAATGATAAALAGHSIAGGPVPGLLGMIVPWWLSVALCCVLVGRALSVGRLSVAVLASQVLFHVLFVVGSVDFFAPQAAGAGHAGHAGGWLTGGSAGGGAAGVWRADGTANAADGAALVGATPIGATHVHVHDGMLHAAHLTLPMLLGHLAAAALTVVVLHRGELILTQLARIGAGVHDQVRRLAVRLLAPLLLQVRLEFGPVARPVRRRERPLRWRSVATSPDAGRAPPLVLAA